MRGGLQHQPPLLDAVDPSVGHRADGQGGEGGGVTTMTGGGQHRTAVARCQDKRGSCGWRRRLERWSEGPRPQGPHPPGTPTETRMWPVAKWDLTERAINRSPLGSMDWTARVWLSGAPHRDCQERVRREEGGRGRVGCCKKSRGIAAIASARMWAPLQREIYLRDPTEGCHLMRHSHAPRAT